MPDSIKIGISSCLLGNSVRYDGGHKLNHYVAETLGKFVEYIPLCPEVECGMSVPREAVRLVEALPHPLLKGRESHTDWSGTMQDWAKKKLKELEHEDLCGIIFKAKSPSCGTERVKVFPEQGGQPRYNGQGFFPRMFIEAFPLLPVEDDGRLHDPTLRENFITRIFTLKRWRDTMKQGMTLGKLIDFHSNHKLLLMSCSVEAYRSLGKLVANAKKADKDELFETYLKELLHSLTLKATIKKNVNVLQHIQGYFKKDISSEEKMECLELIQSYAAGHVPLIVPITLLNHFVRKYDKEYLKKQVYLTQHPVELKLRNHA